MAFVVSLLQGRALQWAESVWQQGGAITASYTAFVHHFKEVFDAPPGDTSKQVLLLRLRQGRTPILEYTLQFRTLAAESGWNEAALLTVFRQGLEPTLRLHLSGYDDSVGLERFIQLAIRVANRREHCLQDQPLLTAQSRAQPTAQFPAPARYPAYQGEEPEPMSVDSLRLTPEERSRCITQGLCLYCGARGHVVVTCPLRPPQARVSAFQEDVFVCKPLLVPVTLTTPSGSFPAQALIDSGSAGNFISGTFCQQIGLPKSPSPTSFSVHTITGRPLTKQVRHLSSPVLLEVGLLHREQTQFLLLEGSTADVILGRPWLILHSPSLCWETGEVTRWGPRCFGRCLPAITPRRTAALSPSSRRTPARGHSSRCAPVPARIALHATSIESPVDQVGLDIPPRYSQFKDVFCPQRAARLPPHRPGDCCIDLLPGEPVPRGRIYPLALPELKAMEEYVTEALQQGYIRHSTSPAASSFFFVKKKDGGLRPCIDYRSLNKITIKNRYPLPLVPSALEQLQGAQIFTKLDLRSAYNLIRIREGDEWKTAFITPSGHYEYCVMPFGLTNAPSVFQGFMNEVFREYLHRFVIVYLDDILVYSRNETEHSHHVSLVLHKLREHHLFAKAEKCSFHSDHMNFLGYNVTASGVSMDEGKVEVINTWTPPKTVKELQRFLGFANFYRRFLKGYSQITAPLTTLLRGKPKSLLWNPEAAAAFALLKRAFVSAPILALPDPSIPFLVEVDASSTGVGAVLSQRSGVPPRRHPCAFFSKKFTPAELNYDIGNRELLAVKLALEEWRHWLEGARHPFVVLTDHKNLEYIREARRLNPRQARWALFFTRFNFTLTYRPGPKNIQADALSRIHDAPECVEEPEGILPSRLIAAPIIWALDEHITQAQVDDPAPPGTPANKTYIPATLRDQVMESTHNSLGTGHPGANQTLSLLQERFWWPGMAKMVRRFVAGCAACAMAKTPRQLPAGKLQPLPIPQRPWSHLGVDFITDLPPSHGFTCIFIVVDRFSKSCKLIPLKRIPTAADSASALFNHVFRHFGLPEDVVSDRGPQFISRFWRAFFSCLGVTVSLTSGYHPQTNGQTERKVQEISRYLRTFCHNHQHSWSQFLPWAEYAQNSLRQATTGLTPFQCVLGYQPPLFPWTGEPSTVPAVNHWYQQSERVWNEAHHHLQRAVRRHQRQADVRRRPNPAFSVGQKVWLSTRDIRMRLPSRKLSPRFIGPFPIIEQINAVTFKLQLPPHYRIHPVFHVSLLKPYHPPITSPSEPGVNETPLPLLLEEGPVYAIREILASRRRRGRLEYLLDWDGYGPEERAWVLRDDILDPALLEAFHRDHPHLPAPRGRGRPRRRRLRLRDPRPAGAGPGGGGNVTSVPELAPATPPSVSTHSPALHSRSPEY